MGKSIGIVSLKGGVGKTSVVSALGGAIAGFGQKVLLIDGNFSAPNLGLHLNVIDPEITLNHVLNRTANLKDAIYESGNLDVMPSSIFERINIKLNSAKSSLSKRGSIFLIVLYIEPALL